MKPSSVLRPVREDSTAEARVWNVKHVLGPDPLESLNLSSSSLSRFRFNLSGLPGLESGDGLCAFGGLGRMMEGSNTVSGTFLCGGFGEELSGLRASWDFAGAAAFGRGGSVTCLCFLEDFLVFLLEVDGGSVDIDVEAEEDAEGCFDFTAKMSSISERAIAADELDSDRESVYKVRCLEPIPKGKCPTVEDGRQRQVELGHTVLRRLAAILPSGSRLVTRRTVVGGLYLQSSISRRDSNVMNMLYVYISSHSRSNSLLFPMLILVFIVPNATQPAASFFAVAAPLARCGPSLQQPRPLCRETNGSATSHKHSKGG